MQFMQIIFTNMKEHNLDRSLFHPLQMRSNLDNSSLCNSKTTILFVLLVRRGNLCKSKYKSTSSEKSRSSVSQSLIKTTKLDDTTRYILLFLLLYPVFRRDLKTRNSFGLAYGMKKYIRKAYNEKSYLKVVTLLILAPRACVSLARNLQRLRKIFAHIRILMLRQSVFPLGSTYMRFTSVISNLSSSTNVR